MFDNRIRPLLDPCLSAVAARLQAIGVSANTLTGMGFFFSLLAFAALSLASYGWALLFLVLSRIMDGLDGPLARLTRPTDLGGFLDIVSDFVFYAGIVFFFAVGKPDAALAAAFLIFSFVGTGSSFLAYAIIVEKRGLRPDGKVRKSFYYLGGLTEGAESIAALVLICLVPGFFEWIAYGFGTLCWLTAIGRVGQAVRDFKEYREGHHPS